jgi:hypothetical protein
MHACTPRGSSSERLVIIEANPAGQFKFYHKPDTLPFARSYVIQKGSITSLPKILQRSINIEVEPYIAVRLFAGQPDPNDSSHFTFEYEINGRRDIVDGWLEADDTVTLKCRNTLVKW